MSKLNIKVVDMDQPVQDYARKVSAIFELKVINQSIFEAFDNFKEEKYIANKIKDDFDKQYGKKLVYFSFVTPLHQVPHGMLQWAETLVHMQCTKLSHMYSPLSVKMNFIY